MIVHCNHCLLGLAVYFNKHDLVQISELGLYLIHFHFTSPEQRSSSLAIEQSIHKSPSSPLHVPFGLLIHPSDQRLSQAPVSIQPYKT